MGDWRTEDPNEPDWERIELQRQAIEDILIPCQTYIGDPAPVLELVQDIAEAALKGERWYYTDEELEALKPARLRP